MIRDKLQLMRAFYRAAYLQLTKSPANLWMASLLQLVYYFVQLTFWLGIKATAAGDLFISKHELVGFLVTLAAVDNLYLFFFGAGKFVSGE